MQTKIEGRRLVELDVLRGLAAVWVMAFHYMVYFNLWFRVGKPVMFFNSGQHAVNLFFMVSGFVIYMTLEKTKRPMDFVVSRFSRLYPAYWCAVLITFVVVRAFGLPGLEVGAKDFAANLTMLQRYFGFLYVDKSYWTLSYELEFYAIMFGLLCLKRLRNPLVICAAFLAFQTLSILLVGLGVVAVPAVAAKVLMLSYGHQFACGIVFYLIYKGGQSRWIHLLPAWAIANEFLMPKMLYGQIDPSAAAMLAFVVCFYLFVYGRLKWMGARALVFLGTISYTLYLIHQHIGYVVIRYGDSHGLNHFVAIGLAVAVAFMLAIGITFTVEKPCLKFIRKWYRSRAPLVAVGSPMAAKEISSEAL